MHRIASLLTLSASALSLASCAAGHAGTRSSDIGNAVVIQEEDLFSTRGRLIDVLATRLVNSQLVESDGCVSLQLRGAKGIQRPILPGIYVEGQRAADSCILDMLSTYDIARVEVYPSGVTSRPGYYSQAGGLILVFLKDGYVPE